MRKLLIVESPNKIKKIKSLLGIDWDVKASVGHIADLPLDSLGIDKANGYKLAYSVTKEKKDVVKGLIAAVKSCGQDNVYLATDPDREGEAISFHLARELGLSYKTAHRVTFQEITASAIQKAVGSPRKIDLALVSAQEARRAIDRLVGYEVSPVLWRKLTSSATLSAGRVQSVAVKLVVEREDEILGFASSYFFSVVGYFNAKGAILKGISNNKIGNAESAKLLLTELSTKSFVISDLRKEPKKTIPSPPYSTSSLQQDASRKLKLSPETTMKIAQKLFEAGYITYMRTDSVNLSQEARQQAIATVVKLCGKEFAEERTFASKQGAQEAHEAIRPTHFEDATIEGSEDEKRLYDLIRKRALASQMKAKVADVTTIHISTTDKATTFVSKATVVMFEGYTSIYTEGVEEEAGEEEISEAELKIPLAIGESTTLHELMAVQTYSKPKSRYSEAELIGQMEKLGIGRPATYAAILDTIRNKRKYVEIASVAGKEVPVLTLRYKEGKVSETKGKVSVGSAKKKLVPTDVGRKVVVFLNQAFDFMDYRFTSDTESKLDSISESKLNYTQVVREFDLVLTQSITKVESLHADLPDKVSSTVTLGEFEGHPLSVGKGKFGVYVRHKKDFYNVANVESPLGITLQGAVTVIQEKRTQDEIKKTQRQEATIKIIGKFQVHAYNGVLYLVTQKEKVKIPTWEVANVEQFDEAKCKQIIKSYKDFVKKSK
jgi:DNA topoisomerase I